jgi:UDP-N-acetylglucosamine/UDP-N-acetylgalactosamine diphosphorylase
MILKRMQASNVIQQITRRIEERLTTLIENGVVVHDPRQVFIGDDVVLENIKPGCQIFPGARIYGANTIIGHGVMLGSEGPAIIEDAALDDEVEVASGYVTNSILLHKARAGSNSHIRACCILEEEASTAHAVGLKQTVLMSFVTLGSLINFCDGLISGGTSRTDHTEIGSGVIHFNFAPWGPSGDKATPSLIGNVYSGTLLCNNRVFIGGLSGLVGPREIGFGAVIPAGQVVREDIDQNILYYATHSKKTSSSISDRQLHVSAKKYDRNLMYISNLFALHEWYRQVRLPRFPQGGPLAYKAKIVTFGISLIDMMIKERLSRFADYLRACGKAVPKPKFIPEPCPLRAQHLSDDIDHVTWVRSLSADDAKALQVWLKKVGDSVWA